MTAFLVADLVAAGRWSLDDPIARHLPAGTRVPRQGERQILVRDLLTHSAALPPLPARMRGRGLVLRAARDARERGEVLPQRLWFQTLDG